MKMLSANCMKVDEVHKFFRAMAKDLKDSGAHYQKIYELDKIQEQIVQYTQSLQFYANKNYDNGLVARMSLGQMTEHDAKTYHHHATNTYNLDHEALEKS